MIRLALRIKRYRRAVRRKVVRSISISGGLLAGWRLSLCWFSISRIRALRARVRLRLVLTRIRACRLAVVVSCRGAGLGPPGAAGPPGPAGAGGRAGEAGGRGGGGGGGGPPRGGPPPNKPPPL